MKMSPYHLAALAVVAIDGLNAVSIRGPYSSSPDYMYGGVLDSRGKHWIVKVPLNTHASTAIEAEAGLAPVLMERLRHGQLPFDIMRPAGFAPMETGRAIVYPRPLGKSIDFDDLSTDQAHELGRTLATIHQLEPTTITDAGMPGYDADMVRKRLLTELHDANAAGNIPAVLLRRWENAIENSQLWHFTPAVVHGDIASDNILWSEGHVSCVLGFGEAHVGDPAQDFASLMSGLDESLFDAIVESYRNSLNSSIDEYFFTRIVLLSEIALARWMMFGIRNQDPAIVREAEGMLDELAQDVASDPDLAPGPVWNVDSLEDGFVPEVADDLTFSSAPSAE
ncbi:phosphotransferase [Arcanobacterium phocisimile]|uniref:Phosphotransferase n=1 Tax=Arcanobacterium phocisimile TaxID=1302235 RepID=A0ABX7IIL6_9ACTO|nr:phosphotransferase [Arcanobacterium phocisimile]QRV01688.1 phosphotransferase [Arcanobacterium phocisimile]